MFEVIKDKIWNQLKEKEISLAMIYDQKGRILWHKGREIIGKDVFTGGQFCRSYIEDSLLNPGSFDFDAPIKSQPGDLSQSAEALSLEGVIIHPIGPLLFLYIDSGTKKVFTREDIISFKNFGDILEELVSLARNEADDLIGTSPAIKKIKDLAVIFAMEEEPALLTGETGVGKNHIAKLIHRTSGRRGKLVIVDTPNIDSTLIESKLFGHKKGAFTGAISDQRGLVDEADKGTLFFDEITEIPISIQAKLLRFLDTKNYNVLGDSTEREADVRIIAATNKDLHKAIQDKEFRHDLHYRLNVLGIDIPPLRQRKEDIKELVLAKQHLLRGKEMGDGFLETICNYHWPGNARELITVLKRAGILQESPITGEKILSAIGTKKNFPGINGNGNHLIERIRHGLKMEEDFWQLVWKPFMNRDFDRETVRSILKEFYAGNFKDMIRELNVDENDYQKFMSYIYKYDIDPRKEPLSAVISH